MYVDIALTFGLRSAPPIFSVVADALAWALHCKDVLWQLHYLDDVLFMGPPGKSVCAMALCVALETCQELGKVEGPQPHSLVSRLTHTG